MVYIDALNLYYRALRDTPYRWLDPVALSDTLLSGDEVIGVKYFTAAIKALPHDPGAPTRQQAYLRALRTVGRLDLQDGFFMRRKSFAALAIGKVGEGLSSQDRLRAWLVKTALLGSGLLKMKPDPIPRVRVWRTEEKGSDVNLASHLIVDARDQTFEKAAVVSNDSDLAWPIEYVRDTSVFRSSYSTPQNTGTSASRRREPPIRRSGKRISPPLSSPSKSPTRRAASIAHRVGAPRRNTEAASRRPQTAGPKGPAVVRSR
jgi:hypothetical protein